MSDFETLLLQEQKNPNAAILQFFLSKYDAEQIIALVEGEDDTQFYYDFLVSYFEKDSIFFFPCGGKRALLALRSFLSDYGIDPEPKKILCLTDKDFDDYLDRRPTNVFQTDFYSIENYFCNGAFFEYLLRKHCAGHLKSKAIEALVKRFSELLNSSINYLLVPMATMCAVREIDPGADFDEISCGDFLRIDPSTARIARNRIQRSRAIARLSAHYSSIPISSIRRFAVKFSADAFNYWLRGKHGLQLIRMIIGSLGSEFRQHSAQLSRLRSFFSVDALRLSKIFLGEIGTLRAYCCLSSP